MIAVWDELVTLNYDACRCLQSADWSTVVGQGSVLFEDSIRLASRSNISQLAWRARQWKTAMKMVNLFVASPYVEITLGCITAKTSLQGPLWPSSKIFWLKCCLRCLKTIVCDCCLRWTCNITPAFSVTCIGDIFVHLSTCHLSTCFVTWPTSKW